MTKSRLYLLLFVVILTILLYMLPRYVVNNTSTEIESESDNAAQSNPMPEQAHLLQISDSLAQKLSGFYESFSNAENQEKRIIFADSLAKAYKTVGKLDSLAKYTEIRAIEEPSLENFIMAGDGYYEAFNFSVDGAKRNYLAEKAQDYYKRVLEENASLLDVKSKLAMTYIAGVNPMQGITLLREVLEEDPENELAIYNLGMLAITSGQLERAVERFETLLELDPNNPEANFYTGYCFYELGKTEESGIYFEKVVKLGIGGDLVNASEDYLKRINK